MTGGMITGGALGRLAKGTLAGAFVGSGALELLVRARRAAAGPRVHVLGFHRVVDTLQALPADVIPSLAITTASLEALCRLARRRYDVLPLEEAAQVVTGRRRVRRDVVVLTFDDGYRDVYQRALPLLRRLSLPATVFVPTGYIGAPEPLLHDRLHALLRRLRRAGRPLGEARLPAPLRAELNRLQDELLRLPPVTTLDRLIEHLGERALRRLAEGIEDLLGEGYSPDEGGRVMTADELRACSDGGIALGAHTISHVALPREPPGRVRAELRRPREDLEAISGRPCESFAFCNGLWTPSLLDSVRQAGYSVAVTTTDRPNRQGDDPLRLGRKVLWEGHAQGPLGRSPSLLLAHLADLFGALGVTRPVDGGAAAARAEARHAAERSWSRLA